MTSRTVYAAVSFLSIIQSVPSISYLLLAFYERVPDCKASVEYRIDGQDGSHSLYVLMKRTLKRPS